MLTTDIKFLVNKLKPADIPEKLKGYDLEIPCQVIYNDTDSCFVKAAHINSVDLAVYGKTLQIAFSYIFEKNLVLEYEQSLSRLFLVSKKRYTGYVMDDQTGKHALDKITGEKIIYTKGLVSAKRDGAPFMRQIFTTVSKMILDGKTEIETLKFIISKVHDLFSGEIEVKDLVLMKKIGEEYKLDSYEMAVFAKKFGIQKYPFQIWNQS